MSKEAGKISWIDAAAASAGSNAANAQISIPDVYSNKNERVLKMIMVDRGTLVLSRYRYYNAESGQASGRQALTQIGSHLHTRVRYLLTQDSLFLISRSKLHKMEKSKTFCYSGFLTLLPLSETWESR